MVPFRHPTPDTRAVTWRSAQSTEDHGPPRSGRPTNPAPCATAASDTSEPSPELTIAGPCSSSCRRAPAVSVQRTSTHQMSSSGNATRLSSQPPSLRCVSTAGIARSTSEAVLLAQASSCTTLPDSQPLQVSAQAFRAPTERRRRRRGRHYEAGHAEAQPGRDPWEPGSQAKQKPGGLDPRIDGSHEPTRAWLVYARLRALDGTC